MIRFLAAIATIVLLTTSVVGAAEVTEPRLALRGYDPVNYFLEGKAEKGLEENSATYDNATYWFKNEANKKLFAANPEKYAPQFSGFCVIDLSRGLKTEPDPEAWTIADGKLYVFGKKRGPGLFAQDGPAIVTKATANWKELRTH
jgi:YHS domain-containing protein